MVDDLNVNAIGSALQVSLGLFVRRLRQPVQGELTLPEVSVLSRLERAGSATTSDLARTEQITPQAMGMTLAGLEAGVCGPAQRLHLPHRRRVDQAA
ncbi:MarR family winged helix-turn-helix transcriptional regulator [Streptomyces decoyicus]|uniref:MarR family winged helix-turn-helix transcriptional regulator n=1 Tax=Streptomyces decoyicus TaxID=249567 RepID=UPI0033B4983A